MEVETSSLQSKNIDITPIKEILLKLINKASQSSPLKQKEYNFIFEIVKLNPNILLEIGFSHEDIYDLIEKDEYLVSNILLNISKSNEYELYLQYFLCKKFSVNSLKTVNKLIQRIEFPSVFIMSYLKKVIQDFKDESQPFLKERMAKLITFFILNLLSHEHITIDIIPSTINLFFNENYVFKELKVLQEKIYTYRNTKNNI